MYLLMPYYRYRARNEKNETIQGVVQAASDSVAADTLTDQGLTILSLQAQGVSILQQSIRFLNRVKGRDLVVFSRQLSVIISATIPLVRGLRILMAQTRHPFFKSVISEITDDVEGGAKLSAALGRHPEIFSSFYISIIRAGETSGKLEEVLAYLADQQEKDYDMLSKIRGAMIYPLFILGGLVVVGTLMMVLVVPQLTTVLTESGGELPFSTKLLIGTSSFITHYWWALIIGFVGLVVGFNMLLRTERGRYAWDLFRLHVPVFGPLLQKIVIVRFTRSLHTLMAGGVPLSKSLEIVSEVAGNVIYKGLILDTVKEVESGNSIATTFATSHQMPLMVSQMLSLGEKTGRIDEILDKLSSFYGREVNNTMNNLTSLIEPLILLIMGVAVGLLVAAIILPIYNLATTL